MSTHSSAPDPALALRITASQPTLAAASLEYMSADPFWAERFGERADRFAKEDAGYHVTYLVTAVEDGSVSPMRAYARWLRGVLVSRGMCTRHLEAHFEALRAAIRRDPAIAPSSLYLDTAIDALRYESQPAAWVQSIASELAVVTPVADANSAGLPFHSAWDPVHLAHYVADALAADHDRSLTDHLAWTAAAITRYDAPHVLARVLDEIEAHFLRDATYGDSAAAVLATARTKARVKA